MAYGRIIGVVSCFSILNPYPRRRLFDFSWPLQTERIVSTLADWSDQMLLLAATSDLVLLGTYFLCVRGAASISIIWLAFNVTVMPTLSRIYGESGRERLTGALRAALRYLFLILLPAAFGLAALSRSAMVLLGGAEYEVGALPLSLLALGSILQATAYILMSALNAIAKTRAFAKIGIANVLTNVALVLLLSPRFGILGASMARVGMWVVNFTLMYRELRRHIVLESDWSSLWKSSISSISMALSVFLLDNLLLGVVPVPSLRIGIDICFGVLLYGILLILLRVLKPDDFSLLDSLLPSSLHRFIEALERLSSR